MADLPTPDRIEDLPDPDSLLGLDDLVDFVHWMMGVHGWTQTQVAAVAGVDQPTISRLLRQRQGIGYAKGIRILRRLLERHQGELVPQHMPVEEIVHQRITAVYRTWSLERTLETMTRQQFAFAPLEVGKEYPHVIARQKVRTVLGEGVDPSTELRDVLDRIGTGRKPVVVDRGASIADVARRWQAVEPERRTIFLVRRYRTPTWALTRDNFYRVEPFPL